MMVVKLLDNVSHLNMISYLGKVLQSSLLINRGVCVVAYTVFSTMGKARVPKEIRDIGVIGEFTKAI